MSLTIEITQKDLASPAVERISSELTRDDVKKAMGDGLRVASARKFNNLHFVYFRSDLAALMENLASIVKRGRNGVYRHVSSTIGAVIFWLKREVDQAPDPTVLPEESEMTNAALKGASEFLGQVWERPIGGSE